ncbi:MULTISPECIES: hypothetical protein [unclassified Bradyrhizobium]|nr:MULTISPECIES: hypothetical protein [unclassified Bradyrhizobium]
MIAKSLLGQTEKSGLATGMSALPSMTLAGRLERHGGGLVSLI